MVLVGTGEEDAISLRDVAVYVLILSVILAIMCGYSKLNQMVRRWVRNPNVLLEVQTK